MDNLENLAKKLGISLEDLKKRIEQNKNEDIETSDGRVLSFFIIIFFLVIPLIFIALGYIS